MPTVRGGNRTAVVNIEAVMTRGLRAWVLAAVALVMVVSGCATPGGSGTGPDESVVLPTGPAQEMAAMRQVGGFVPPGWTFIEAPPVVVYSDGRAVADAHRVLTLTLPEVAALVRELRRDLRGLGPTAKSSESEFVADAPSTVLEVRSPAGGVQSVSAYALGIVDGYPDALVAARDRMAHLAERVTQQGTVYTGQRVRLVADARSEGTVVMDWPAAVPVPPANPAGVRVADLEGDAAAALVSAIPPVQELDGPWPVLRLPDGSLVGVAWRYLLPDE